MKLILMMSAIVLTTIMLLGVLIVGIREKKKSVIAFKRSMILVVAYNIVIILNQVTHQGLIHLLVEKLIPVLTLFAFRYFIFDFYHSVFRKKMPSFKSIVIHVIPLVFLFLMFVDFFRTMVNSVGVEGDIDIFNVAVVFVIVAYQVLVFTDILFICWKGYRRSLERYRQVYMAHILVNTIYIIVTIGVLVSGQLEDNIIVSTILYSLYLAFLIVNFIRPEWLPHAQTEQLVLKEKKIGPVVSDRVKDRRALDGLTGVFTREYFIRYIKGLDTNDDSLAVVLMSITGLKLINEGIGYDAGDDILLSTSVILCDAFQNATVARMNGSMFAVLVSGKSEEEISALIHSVKNQCDEAKDFAVNLYFGFYRRNQQDLSPYDIYQRAEEELYYNKIVVNQKHQDSIAKMLYKNFGRLLPSLSGHLKRCSDMAFEFGKHLGMGDEILKDLKNAALLHDIALTIMPNIVEYNIAFNDDFEKRVYKSHVSKGYDIAIESGINPRTAKAIMHHHENYNGSGYPHGLVGEEIDLLSQIVAIVDLTDMVINYGKQTKHLESILTEKIDVVFSKELVYNMIAFLKGKRIIEE